MSEKLTKADNLCKELAATLSQNPDTVEITITIPHPSLGTTTVTGDEIEQLGNEAANPETALCVNFNIVGDLLIGELDSWHLGICEVKTGDTDDLLVCGEGGRVVERVDTDVWTTSTLFPDTEVKDLAKIADAINSAIAAEYSEI